MESDAEKVIEEIGSIRAGFEEGNYFKVSRIGLNISPKYNLLVYKLFFNCRGGEGSLDCSYEFPNTRSLVSSAEEVRDYLSKSKMNVEILSV